MFVMIQQLKIGDFTFDYLESVSLTTSRNDPMDVLTVKLPKYKSIKVDDIKVNDKVTWKAGYTKYGMIDEFTGQVAEVNQKLPLEIRCFDFMYLCQLKTVNRNFQNEPIDGFLQNVLPPGMKVKLQGAISGTQISMACNGKSARNCLWQLRRYGIDAFFRGEDLYVQSPAKIEVPSDEDIKKFKIGFNIIENNVNNKDGKLVKVVARSYDPKSGETKEESYGEGEEKVFNVDGVPSGDLKNRAAQIYYEKFGKSLIGDFTTFGFPSVYHSDIVEFIDEKLESGKVKRAFVDKVEKTYNGAGATYRQKVYLGMVHFSV